MILSIEEARETLRISNDSLDEVIKSTLKAIPSYLKIRTGSDWISEPINPFAKETAKILLRMWVDMEFADVQLNEKMLEGHLFTLTMMANEED